MRILLAAALVAVMAAPGLTSAFAEAPAFVKTSAGKPARLTHEKFKIVGTVVKVHADQLDVKAVDGALYEIDFPDSAPVMRKMKKVARTELKPGVKVIVNALGHDMFDLEATDVQLVD